MDDSRSRAGTILGDYRLDLLLEESPGACRWLAEQVSIHRPVTLVELKEEALPHREDFLDDVRAQAAVNQPLMGSVYEAVSDTTQCFVALERLGGSTFADRALAREALPPGTIVHVLARLADCMAHLEAAGTNTHPLGLASIYLDTHGLLRLENLACAGERPPERSTGDVAALGSLLKPLAADGLPGASRVHTLLAWMRGEGLEQPLTWTQVRDYSEQIEKQLTEPQAPVAVAAVESAPERKRRKARQRAVVSGIVATAAVVAVYFAFKGGKDQPAPSLPGPVGISAGTHPTPDGSEENLAGFEISGHEVTIREYRDFLDALKTLPADLQQNYDADGQPASKAGHMPAEWEAMLSAARSGGRWNDKAMSLECPVVNVDWWDAAAYCKWRGGRLPTQEEWFAAVRTGVEDIAKLSAAGWGSVQEIPAGDRTPAGLYGMAGSVAEWTRDAETNPANPLGAKAHVIAGASYERPGGGALAREWTQDLTLRRPDLGFRLVMQER